MSVKSSTKAQLLAQVAALQTEICQLIAGKQALREEVAALNDQQLTRQRSLAPRTPTARPAYVAPQWQVERVAAMQAAKAAAIAGKCVVRVGGAA